MNKMWMEKDKAERRGRKRPGIWTREGCGFGKWKTSHCVDETGINNAQNITKQVIVWMKQG